jgi:hypothetical protein
MLRSGHLAILLAFSLPVASGWADSLNVEGAPKKSSLSFKKERRTPPDISDIPLDSLTGKHRDRTIEILTKPVSWIEGRKEMFPCHQELLEWLIDHPDAVGEYWKQLGISVIDVERTDDGYVCHDPSGSTVYFHVVADQPNMRVCYCVGESPAGILPFKMRAELVIVHRFTFEEVNGAGTYISQKLDGFATAAGPTLKLAMKLAPGQAEQMVDSCVQEMKVFFSVMCRLMQLRPQWSLDKMPAAAKSIPENEKKDLEAILMTLPPAPHAPIVIRRSESTPIVEKVATKPEESATK